MNLCWSYCRARERSFTSCFSAKTKFLRLLISYFFSSSNSCSSFFLGVLSLNYLKLKGFLFASSCRRKSSLGDNSEASLISWSSSTSWAGFSLAKLIGGVSYGSIFLNFENQWLHRRYTLIMTSFTKCAMSLNTKNKLQTRLIEISWIKLQPMLYCIGRSGAKSVKQNRWVKATSIQNWLKTFIELLKLPIRGLLLAK